MNIQLLKFKEVHCLQINSLTPYWIKLLLKHILKMKEDALLKKRCL